MARGAKSKDLPATIPPNTVIPLLEGKTRDQLDGLERDLEDYIESTGTYSDASRESNPEMYMKVKEGRIKARQELLKIYNQRRKVGL